MGKKLLCLFLLSAALIWTAGCGGGNGELDWEGQGLVPPEEKAFYFGTKDKEEFAQVEAHDPTVFRDPESGSYYSYATDSGIGRPFPIMGIPVRRSDDLIRWEFLGRALDEDSIEEARDNGEGLAYTTSFWAPDIVYKNGEYRLYYASTKAFGSRESRIFLAVSDSPEGPFVNRGVVVSSFIGDGNLGGPNAIDPDVIETPEGDSYMVYGSYGDGIYLKQLGEDGLALQQDRSAEDYYGVLLAQKGYGKLDGPEGPALLYSGETGYYYLFLSYGWLGDTYDIRVGRSKEIAGPYVDFAGNAMTDTVYDTVTGTKLACSYRFAASNPGGDQPYTDDDWEWGGFRAPGHGVPLEDEDGSLYFVHHIRDGAEEFHTVTDTESTYTMHYLMTRKMVFVDGWPLLSPEEYAGEEEQPIPASWLKGEWEIIAFTDENNEQKAAVPAVFKGKKVKGEAMDGTYEYEEAEALLTIHSGETTIRAKVLPCFDLENHLPNICFTGIDDKGVTYWGKRAVAAE